ncbi:MAG: CcmD family protein [Dehalococcoidia bacterium]|nr:CcmD family protein [Dehalococcoidia bacterium]
MKDVKALFALAPTAPVIGMAIAPQQAATNSNLSFLFVAYTLTWVAFFGYIVYMSRKQQALRRDIDALKKQLEDKQKSASLPGTGR